MPPTPHETPFTSRCRRQDSTWCPPCAGQGMVFLLHTSVMCGSWRTATWHPWESSWRHLVDAVGERRQLSFQGRDLHTRSTLLTRK